MNNIKEKCRESFNTHKATLIQDTDRYLIIDWRRADGSSNYYVNYIVDKQRGSLIVSGDLGDSIATWYNRVEPAKLKNWIYNDIGYYISKLQCASDKYVYDTDDIMSDIKAHFADYDIDPADYIDFGGIYNDFEDEEEFWEFIEEEVAESTQHRSFLPTEKLTDVIGEIDADYFEWLYRCGEKIHLRVYLWAVGFYMACEQLGI